MTSHENESHRPDFIPALTPQEDFSSSPSKVSTNKVLSVKTTFVADETNVKFLRGQMLNRKSMSGNYSLATTDFLLGITSLAVAPTIGLPRPSLVGIGKTYIIKDEAGGSATTTITVKSEGEKTIDGSASTTLTSNFSAKSFYSDGNNWFTY